jgi:hypothetical protein
MNVRHARRRLVAGATALVAVLGLVGAACTPPAPPSNFTFRAEQVTVLQNNDPYSTVNVFGQLFCGIVEVLDGCYDEPYLINIWFKVTIGQPNSAQAGVVSTRADSGQRLPAVCEVGRQAPAGLCPVGSETLDLPSGTSPRTGATVTFGQMPRPDVLDLANGEPITIAGVWTWAMEQDLIGVATPNQLASVLRTALNGVLANEVFNGTPEELVQFVVDLLGQAIGVGGAALLSAITSQLGGDDLLGSRMNIFIGSRGLLADVIDGVVPDLAGFNLGIASAGIPDVLGISVRSTNNRTIRNQVFDRDGVHVYRFRASR